jgi:hypothetical protein
MVLTDYDRRATPEERAILASPCEGERCWWNPETGYREYCAKHEAVIADIVERTRTERHTGDKEASNGISMQG